jgi:hypothetical protein
MNFQTNPKLNPNVSPFNAVRTFSSALLKMQLGWIGSASFQIPTTPFSSQEIFRRRSMIRVKLLNSVTKRKA